MQEKTPSRRSERALAFQVLYGLEFAPARSLIDLKKLFAAAPRQGITLEMLAEEKEAMDALTAQKKKKKKSATEMPEAPHVEEPEGFAWELVQGVWNKRDALDDVIRRNAKNWRLERLGRIELTLLRLAVYEMMFRRDVPRKVAINEALDLARQFGEEKAIVFLNGVLDAAAKELPGESSNTTE